jgi:hypothetical protein
MSRRMLFVGALVLGASSAVGGTHAAEAEPVPCTGRNQPICDMRVECYMDPDSKWVCHTYYRYWP